jgi:hypothetical protein
MEALANISCQFIGMEEIFIPGFEFVPERKSRIQLALVTFCFFICLLICPLHISELGIPGIITAVGTGRIINRRIGAAFLDVFLPIFRKWTVIMFY